LFRTLKFQENFQLRDSTFDCTTVENEKLRVISSSSFFHAESQGYRVLDCNSQLQTDFNHLPSFSVRLKLHFNHDEPCASLLRGIVDPRLFLHCQPETPCSREISVDCGVDLFVHLLRFVDLQNRSEVQGRCDGDVYFGRCHQCHKCECRPSILIIKSSMTSFRFRSLLSPTVPI
jgi:hypothetical protein